MEESRANMIGLSENNGQDESTEDIESSDTTFDEVPVESTLSVPDETLQQLTDDTDRDCIVLNAINLFGNNNVCNKNILITGASGSGKTQAAKQLLDRESSLCGQPHVLIIDFNNEYSDIVSSLNGKEYNIISEGMPFNPFVCSDQSQIDMHMESFIANMQAITGMGAIQIDQLRQTLYDINSKKIPLDKVPAYFERNGSSSINSWMRPGLLLCKRNTRSNELFKDHKVVSLKMGGVSNQISKKMLMAFVLDHIYKLASNNLVDSVRVVIEEAHLVSNIPWLERLMREGRKYGIGVTVVTQSPFDLQPWTRDNCAQQFLFQMSIFEAKKIAPMLAGTKVRNIEKQIASLAPLNGIYVCNGVAQKIYVDIYQASKHDEADHQSDLAKSCEEVAENSEKRTLPEKLESINTPADSGAILNQIVVYIDKGSIRQENDGVNSNCNTQIIPGCGEYINWAGVSFLLGLLLSLCYITVMAMR